MKNHLLVLFFSLGLIGHNALAQNAGICTGKVMEQEVSMGTGSNEKKVEEKYIISARVFILKKNVVVKSTMTNDLGVYQFDQMDPGEYSIKVEQAGYPAREIENVKIEAGKITLVRKIYLKEGKPGDNRVIFKKK